MDKHDDKAEYHVDEERMGAMLALTAIHDLMKVELLLPTVTAEHAPFCGFAGGAQQQQQQQQEVDVLYG